MTTLTQCQQQVLDMLISYQKERGFPPTNQEVATMLGYRSVNAAVEHLRALEKKGVITIKRGVARGITLHTAVKDDDSTVLSQSSISPSDEPLAAWLAVEDETGDGSAAAEETAAGVSTGSSAYQPSAGAGG